jgi:hypothetical protein
VVALGGSAILVAALPLLAFIFVLGLLLAAILVLLLLALLAEAALLALLAEAALLALLAAELALPLAPLIAHFLFARAGLVAGTGEFLGILLGALDAILLILVVVELAESRLVAELAALIRLALILVELAHLSILRDEVIDGTAPPLA